jgi:hypothetical protein
MVPTGHVMPQPQAATFPTSNGLQTPHELPMAYALPPSQAPGYLVHGKVGGKYKIILHRENSFILLTHKPNVSRYWYSS